MNAQFVTSYSSGLPQFVPDWSVGGTPYSLVQDIQANTAAAFGYIQNSSSKISTLKNLTQDTVARIAPTIAMGQDLATSASLLYAKDQDGTLGISSFHDTSQDARASISVLSGYVVVMDAIAQVSEQIGASYDFNSAISMARVEDQDFLSGISSQVLVVQDSRAAISEGHLYTVFMDGAVSVSEVLAVNQANIVKVSSDYQSVADLASGISSGYILTQDGTAHVINVDFEQIAKGTLRAVGALGGKIKAIGALRGVLKARNDKIIIIRIGDQP